MSSAEKAVVVVGGGIIGLSVAWDLAVHRVGAVTLVDPVPAPAPGASWVAGGMLAPVTEGWPGEEAVLDLGSASLSRWPDFAARLDVPLRTDGTVAAALDAADAAELSMLADHLESRGRRVERLTGSALRSLDPALGPAVRSGLFVPGDLAVDNRVLLRRLVVAAREAGVVFDTAAVRSVAAGSVELADGRRVGCDTVVVAAGAWSGQVCPALAGLVHPVKGEILRLRARPGVVPLRHTMRGLVESRHVYLVPREGGELVLGATQYDAGFDDEVTVSGVRDLLVGAERVMPGIAEYGLTECAAGLRAGSRDNLPLLGAVEPGVGVAAGHHRNGLLLAPITAEAVRAIVLGAEPPAEVAVADPARHSARRETR